MIGSLSQETYNSYANAQTTRKNRHQYVSQAYIIVNQFKCNHNIFRNIRLEKIKRFLFFHKGYYHLEENNKEINLN